MKKYNKVKWLFLATLFLLCVMGVPVRAEAKKASTTSVVIKKETNIRLYLGQSLSLSDLPEGEIIMDREDVLTISPKNVITAVAKGTVHISVKTDTETIVVAKVTVIANERLEGLHFDVHSFPSKVVGTGEHILTIPAFEGMSCQWSSETPAYASVTSDGKITPIHAGTAYFRVKVVDNYGGRYEFVIPLVILEPHFEMSKTNLAKGCRTTLYVKDSSGNPIVYKTLDGSIISLCSYSSTGVEIKADKVGSTSIIASVDGVEFQCRIVVTDPRLKTSYGFYQGKKKVGLSVLGLNSDSRPVWSSGDGKVATVNQKGKVSTLQYGSTVIQCQVDGKTLNYYLAVSTKTAVKAMRWGYKQLGRKKYSQARRMSANYFDCSSFVYRCYRAAGRYLVRRASWAPVAAEIGGYYVRKKKNIKASGIYDEKKLRPGDLICFGGSSARRNGRYKRIYHIAMYIGNGKTIESSSTYNNVVIRDRGTLKKKDIPVVVRP